MTAENTNFKDQITQKFHEFELMGLESYAKYLDLQLKMSNKRDSMETYVKYISKEIERNNKKIESVKAKIKPQ
jgi:hypothetical protein